MASGAVIGERPKRRSSSTKVASSSAGRRLRSPPKIRSSSCLHQSAAWISSRAAERGRLALVCRLATARDAPLSCSSLVQSSLRRSGKRASVSRRCSAMRQGGRTSVWFEPPSLLMKDGQWELSIPADVASVGADMCANPQIFTSLDSVFDFESRREDAARYDVYIKKTLTRLVKEEGRRFGALILEPLLMGAGGMIFVDPLFQRTLITTIRTNPELIGASCEQNPSAAESSWSGIPIIADEVFTGLYRLGRASSSSFWASPSDPQPAPPQSQTPQPQPQIPATVAPDITVHAKLLTAGLLPLAITSASESIFQAFLSSSKTDALLHGHSYTAHAVGCSVANSALDTFRKLDGAEGAWDGFKAAWRAGDSSDGEAAAHLANVESSPSANVYSFFPPSLLHALSHHPRLAGCFALGTVLVLKMASRPGAAGGYTSTATTDLQARLLTSLDGDSSAIHSRVLGDIIYFMTSLTTTKEGVERLGKLILRALDAEE